LRFLVSLVNKVLQEEDFAELDAALSAMRAATTVEDWEIPHRRFHQLLVSQAGEQLRATMSSYTDQSQRYRLILAYREIHAQSVSVMEHGRILQTCRERNREEAVRQYARHLARTALTALAHLAPEYEPVAVRTALWLVHMGSSPPVEASQQRRHAVGNDAASRDTPQDCSCGGDKVAAPRHSALLLLCVGLRDRGGLALDLL
jgi:hypothetical protein